VSPIDPNQWTWWDGANDRRQTLIVKKNEGGGLDMREEGELEVLNGVADAILSTITPDLRMPLYSCKKCGYGGPIQFPHPKHPDRPREICDVLAEPVKRQEILPSDPEAAKAVYALAYKIGKEWKIAPKIFPTFGQAFDVWLGHRTEKLLGDALKTYFGGVPPEDVIIVSLTTGSSKKVLEGSL
jgi:hypothetical protein